MSLCCITYSVGDINKVDPDVCTYCAECADLLLSNGADRNITESIYGNGIGIYAATGLYFVQIIDDNSQIIEIRKILLE